MKLKLFKNCREQAEFVLFKAFLFTIFTFNKIAMKMANLQKTFKI